MDREEESDGDIPDAKVCDERAKQFADVTGTDEACAHFFLQDHGWELQPALNAFFQEADSGDDTAPDRTDSSIGGASGTSDSRAEHVTESDKGVPTLKVISWNVDGLDEKNFNSRMKAVCTIIITEKPHVVFLQEVIAEGHSIIDKYLNDEYLLISGKNENSVVPYFTVMLLKRKDVKCRKQSMKPFPTTMMGRTLLTVEVDFVNSVPLFLMTAHLESTKDYDRERKKQLRIAYQSCCDVPDGVMVIFGGDLNIRDKEIDEVGGVPDKLVDAWQFCGGKKFTEFTWDLVKNDNIQWEKKFKPRCRFDRMYVSKDGPFSLEDFMLVGMQRIQNCLCFPSDHFGIMCTLKPKAEPKNP